MTTKTKKATNKPATKRATALRKPQLRVLQTLAKAKEALNRSEISEKGKVDLAWLVEWLGASNPKTRAKNEKKMGFKSLISLGYVKTTEQEGRATYTITATGRKALQANGG